jgi:hypothetical protein
LWLLDLHIHAAYLRENRTEPSSSWSPPPPPEGFPQQQEERRKSQAGSRGRKGNEVAIHYMRAVLTSDMPTTTARLYSAGPQPWVLSCLFFLAGF